jgi:phosphate:Na+ symporter
MATILERMLGSIIQPFTNNEQSQDELYPHLSTVEGIEMREEKLDYLDKKIVKYLRKMGQQELSENQSHQVFGMMSIVNDIESIGDTIDKNMIPLIAKKSALQLDFSSEGKEELIIYHEKICKQVSRFKKAFSNMDKEKAEHIIIKEGKYSDLETKYRVNHLGRLHQNHEESIATHDIYMELIDLLKQINIYSGEMAKVISSL